MLRLVAVLGLLLLGACSTAKYEVNQQYVELPCRCWFSCVLLGRQSCIRLLSPSTIRCRNMHLPVTNIERHAFDAC